MSDESPATLPPEPTPEPRPSPEPTAEPTPDYSTRADEPAPYHSAPVAAPTPAPGGSALVVALVAALIMGTIAGVAGGFLGGRLSSGGGLQSQKITVVPLTTDEPVVAAAAAAVPSIVNIDFTAKNASAGGQNGLPNSHPTVPTQGNGSGVAFKKADGGGTYILTNNHVVADATRITVADASGKTIAGKLIGRDTDSDIAVVQIAEDLPIINLGDSSKLTVGQTVVAIGSPFGFAHSVTSGVVSALGRSLDNIDGTSGANYPLADVIQTDAAINPGNSGGALVDRAGRLVGINTAIYSGTGQSGGIGFAIPVNTAIKVADQLISGGKVGHAYIGLIGSTVTAEIAAQKKLPLQQGAIVNSLAVGAGAITAGVKVGDIVTAVGSADVRTMDDLILQVRRHAIGDIIKLTLRRGTQTLTLDVKVGDKPANLPSLSTSSTITTP